MALTMNAFVFWLQGLLIRFAPRFAVSQFVNIESTLGSADRSRITNDVLASPKKMEVLQALSNNAPFDLLRAGFDNDMKHFAAIERLPLEQVRCPTLVVHGTHDGDVPYRHAEEAAREIPGAELFTVEKGWHLLALSDGDNAYLQAEIDFLKKHLGA